VEEKHTHLEKYAKAAAEVRNENFGGVKCYDCGSRNIIPYMPELVESDCVMDDDGTFHFTIKGTPWCSDCHSFNIVQEYIRVTFEVDYVCCCEDYDNGRVSNCCPVHNDNPADPAPGCRCQRKPL
jgi:hypothetical protein